MMRNMYCKVTCWNFSFVCCADVISFMTTMKTKKEKTDALFVTSKEIMTMWEDSCLDNKW
jgi:hypothetical protein